MPQGTGSWRCEWCGLWFDGPEPKRYVYGREQKHVSLEYGTGPLCLCCFGKLYVEDKSVTNRSEVG